MPDHRHFLPVEARKAAYHGGIVAEGAVTMHLAPIGEYALHVIQGVGPLRMPRQLGLDPSALLRRKLPAHLFNLLVQALQAGSRLAIIAGGSFQRRNLPFDILQLAFGFGSGFQAD